MLMDPGQAVDMMHPIVQSLGPLSSQNLKPYAEKITNMFSSYPTEKEILVQLMRDKITQNIVKNRSQYNSDAILNQYPPGQLKHYADIVYRNNPNYFSTESVEALGRWNAKWGMKVWSKSQGIVEITSLSSSYQGSNSYQKTQIKNAQSDNSSFQPYQNTYQTAGTRTQSSRNTWQPENFFQKAFKFTIDMIRRPKQISQQSHNYTSAGFFSFGVVFLIAGAAFGAVLIGAAVYVSLSGPGDTTDEDPDSTDYYSGSGDYNEGLQKDTEASSSAQQEWYNPSNIPEGNAEEQQIVEHAEVTNSIPISGSSYGLEGYWQTAFIPYFYEITKDGTIIEITRLMKKDGKGWFTIDDQITYIEAGYLKKDGEYYHFFMNDKKSDSRLDSKNMFKLIPANTMDANIYGDKAKRDNLVLYMNAKNAGCSSCDESKMMATNYGLSKVTKEEALKKAGTGAT